MLWRKSISEVVMQRVQLDESAAAVEEKQRAWGISVCMLKYAIL